MVLESSFLYFSLLFSELPSLQKIQVELYWVVVTLTTSFLQTPCAGMRRTYVPNLVQIGQEMTVSLDFL